jgi:catechol 2,3-dioxygenase-like lactoylglutathione lyase family enzyme
MTSASTLSNSKVMTFIAVREAARAKAFYRDILGLRFVSEDQFAVVFDLNGIMLRVTPTPEMTPVKYTVLGWEVSDIRAAIDELRRAGVTFERFGDFMKQDELGIWTAPGGTMIAWFKDPDGNLLSLAQF